MEVAAGNILKKMRNRIVHRLRIFSLFVKSGIPCAINSICFFDGFYAFLTVLWGQSGFLPVSLLGETCCFFWKAAIIHFPFCRLLFPQPVCREVSANYKPHWPPCKPHNGGFSPVDG